MINATPYGYFLVSGATPQEFRAALGRLEGVHLQRVAKQGVRLSVDRFSQSYGTMGSTTRSVPGPLTPPLRAVYDDWRAGLRRHPGISTFGLPLTGEIQPRTYYTQDGASGPSDLESLGNNFYWRPMPPWPQWATEASRLLKDSAESGSLDTGEVLDLLREIAAGGQASPAAPRWPRLSE